MTLSEHDSRRRALVTGGAVRVGRSISLALARAGYDVAVHHHSSGEAAARLVRELRDRGGRAFGIAADLSAPEEIRRLFTEFSSEWERLDLLVNNAAIFPGADPTEVEASDWDRVFAINLRAPFLCAKEAARLMGAEGGSIVNVADVAAFEAWPAHTPYAASKAGLVSVTRSLARAWAPRVRVNAVAPGPVLLPEGHDEEEDRRAAARTTVGRTGSPEDVAEAVLYLAAADYVTGEVIRVDGGSHLLRSSGVAEE